jgi:hypothetical protein
MCNLGLFDLHGEGGLYYDVDCAGWLILMAGNVRPYKKLFDFPDHYTFHFGHKEILSAVKFS